MIIAENVKKTFKKRVLKKNKKYEQISALENLNLNIKKGEIFGLIGPNGAGKTTTLKILSTLIIPDEGKITIDGYDVVKDPDIIKKKVGLLAGEFTRSLYWRLSGRENLRFFAKIREIWKPEKRIDELVNLFSLKENENELVMKYSTGNKHKLALALGLLHDPQILFLDEPLTGIDPVTAYEIKDIIRNRLKDKTVIWASHNLFEIEEMCDRIALINNGKIILQGTPDILKKDYWDHTKILISVDKAKVFEGFKNVSFKEDKIEIKTRNVKETLSEIMDIIKNNDIEIYDIKTVKPSLEEIFMEKIKNA